MTEQTMHEQQQMKKAASELRASGLTASAIGYGVEEECRRLSLMERVYAQRRRAQGEALQAERLGELQDLLEKNPEIARILDLMECLKG